MNAKIATALRIFFGVFMLIFGLDKFLHFVPIPEIQGDGGILMEIFSTSGFMSLIGILEVIGGLALLLKKFVPLALTILIAIMFNALVIHILLDPDPVGSIGSAFGLILGVANVYAHKERFSSLLSA